MRTHTSPLMGLAKSENYCLGPWSDVKGPQDLGYMGYGDGQTAGEVSSGRRPLGTKTWIDRA